MGGSSSKKKKDAGKQHLFDYGDKEVVMVGVVSGESFGPNASVCGLTGRHCLIRKNQHFETDISFYDNYDAQIETEYEIDNLSFGNYEKGEKKLTVFLVEQRDQGESAVENAIQNSDALLITFTWEHGLKGVEKVLDRVARFVDDDVSEARFPIVLVETKKDKFEDYDCTPALELVKEHQIGYIRTSAKTGENIKELFQQLGDWCFLHQDQGLKEFLPTNVKKAQKN